jgi:acetyl-CoA acetyltransferase
LKPYGISRQEQDEFAAASQEMAARAQAEGRFAASGLAGPSMTST